MTPSDHLSPGTHVEGKSRKSGIGLTERRHFAHARASLAPRPLHTYILHNTMYQATICLELDVHVERKSRKSGIGGQECYYLYRS